MQYRASDADKQVTLGHFQGNWKRKTSHARKGHHLMTGQSLTDDVVMKRTKRKLASGEDRSVKNSGHWFRLHFPCQVTRGRGTPNQLSHAHLWYIAVRVYLILTVLNAFHLSWACRRQEIWEIQLNSEPKWGKKCWYQLRGCSKAIAELLFPAFLMELCVLFALTLLLRFQCLFWNLILRMNSQLLPWDDGCRTNTVVRMTGSHCSVVALEGWFSITQKCYRRFFWTKRGEKAPPGPLWVLWCFMSLVCHSTSSHYLVF